jgi:hypothetical protein
MSTMDRTETYHSNGALMSVVDNRNLDDMKAKKWDEINAYREVILDRGLWYMGYLWGSDERSRANITGVTAGIATGIPLPTGFTWRDNNNNNVSFTATNIVTLGAYMLGYVNEVYNASWTMKTTVDALTTLDAVDAFIIANQTWPDGNMDGTKPA